MDETLADFELRKFVAPEFIFGLGARNLVSRYARNIGARKVFVVSDPGVCAAGWTGEAVASLQREGIPTAVFTDVSSNPRADEVMAGAQRYAEEGCNCIIAIGGGSPMDCAKGIGIVAAAPGTHILEYEGVDEVTVPTPPIICIPTTAGTAADVSQFAIITDPSRSVKIAIISKAIVPDASLVDPEVTLTMDPLLTACTAMDALCHSIESYVSSAHSPVTDLHALHAARLIHCTLPEVLERPDDLVLRGRMMLASLEAGLAFSNASLGAVHAMAHSLGGLADVAHGEANALLLSRVIDYNFNSVPERYREIATALGIRTEGVPIEDVHHMLVAEVEALGRHAGITDTLGSLGVTRDRIPDLARKAMNDACMATNPRVPTLRDIEALYESVL